MHLYGASATSTPIQLYDGIMLTELVEFALSLIPVLKGQEAFSGIAYLQSYKLVHATRLAELGETAAAQRFVALCPSASPSGS